MKLFTRKPTPIECQKVVELVTAYLDDALSARDRRRLETHLAACPYCSGYLEQIRATIALTGRVDAEDLPPDALEDLTRVFRAWARDS
ncbi:MAG: zf-HC2 domain-containing protein [Solirubrobacteraceae bacterium]